MTTKVKHIANEIKQFLVVTLELRRCFFVFGKSMLLAISLWKERPQSHSIPFPGCIFKHVCFAGNDSMDQICMTNLILKLRKYIPVI